jgi:hypothetical protein
MSVVETVDETLLNRILDTIKPRIIATANVINTARAKSTHSFPHPHLEMTRYKPGSNIKITLNGSKPSNLTAIEDQVRTPSVFTEWSIEIIANKVIPTAINMTTAPRICKNKTKLYNKTTTPPLFLLC